ncbi:MauE/DoxX family redox-associated membrane protein [Actinoallomurus sp. NPDC050550]|uniref:MauE/DoxX family redox-associated membrane protein n=1 Tax=Actinoallomurus sp. NPDC050550 TaxID=3154937 RepID=UPI0033F04216
MAEAKADSARRRTKATGGASAGGKTASATRGSTIEKTEAVEDRAGLIGRIHLPAAIQRRQGWITLVVRVALAAILGIAGYAKFSEPPALQKTAVLAYQILPKGMVTPVALGLPVLEMVLAAMILLGFATRVMAICVGLLFIVFIAGIISVAARGLSINCGCFGGGGTVGKGQTHYLREVFRDLGFLALAAWLMVFPRGKLALDRVLGLYTT